ncbi:hypothetical protein N8590_00910 [bacterium]|jgi:hypothetical protein|nr:hypothetical protein [Planctomicrobium sp.]MDA7527524.1 hypothetical protein [bacterium]
MSRGEMLDVAATVAWRYSAYRSYHSDEAEAVKAIRRKCPSFTKKQCENAFQSGVKLYTRVKKLVKENADDLWKLYKEGDDSYTNLLDDQLRKEFPAYRVSTLRTMVGMNFYYWHMR